MPGDPGDLRAPPQAPPPRRPLGPRGSWAWGGGCRCREGSTQTTVWAELHCGDGMLPGPLPGPVLTTGSNCPQTGLSGLAAYTGLRCTWGRGSLLPLTPAPGRSVTVWEPGSLPRVGEGDSAVSGRRGAWGSPPPRAHPARRGAADSTRRAKVLSSWDNRPRGPKREFQTRLGGGGDRNKGPDVSAPTSLSRLLGASANRSSFEQKATRASGVALLSRGRWVMRHRLLPRARARSKAGRKRMLNLHILCTVAPPHLQLATPGDRGTVPTLPSSRATRSPAFLAEYEVNRKQRCLPSPLPLLTLLCSIGPQPPSVLSPQPQEEPSLAALWR